MADIIEENTAGIGFIPRKKEGTGSYQDMHLEGLEILQKLAGSKWTDYNEHDPGVTILEALAYSLTELEYKTTLPIKDLLLQYENQNLVSGDNALFVPSDIFTINAVTLNDYRKIIIDQITNVKNAWVEQVNPKNTSSILEKGKIKGLLRVKIELYNYMASAEELTVETQRIKSLVRKIFSAQRSLCETLYEVVVLQAFEVQMSFNITLDVSASSEEVLAKVYNVANGYMTHEVKFHSLWEMESKGLTTDQIFEGPKLENGFILDTDLTPPINQIVISDILKVIAQIEGVININSFQLQYPSPDGSDSLVTTSDKIQIPPNHSPKLIFPLHPEQTTFQHQGISFYPDINNAQKQLNFIDAVDLGDFRTVSSASNSVKIPKGQYRNIEEYQELRHLFPVTYGIGHDGLMTGLDKMRYAQAKQLKAYLQPLDQLMANFLAQLRHLFDLYSTKTGANQSYFYQELSRDSSSQQIIRPNNNDSDLTLDKSKLFEDWSNTLAQINTQFDRKALSRLNFFADALLARFNEVFPSYSLRKFNESKFDKVNDNLEFDQKLLNWKRKFLSSYADISYNKMRAFNYSTFVIDENTTERKFENPAIIRKICLYLGIENIELRSLSDVIGKSGIKIYKIESLLQELYSENINVNITEKAPDDINEEFVDDIVVLNSTIENLLGAFYYSGNEQTILHHVLREGVKSSNYTVKPSTSAKDAVYYVVFKAEGHHKKIVHVSKTNTEAQNAINNAISFLSMLSSQSEGMYLIEHLTLAPPLNEANFGFEIELLAKLNNEPIQLVETCRQNYGSRNTTLNQLSTLLDSESCQFTVEGGNSSYFINISNSNNQPLAKINVAFASSDLANQSIAGLKNEFSIHKGKLVSSAVYYSYYNDLKVNENFYSFRMSFVMPDWPARFQDENFKKLFTNTLYEQTSMHCHASALWLDYHKMKDFEGTYFEWLKLKSTQQDSEQLLLHSYQLIQYLQQNKS